MAEIHPEQEETALREALACDGRDLKVLLRLALAVEFRGDRAEAGRLVEQAMAYHRSYESYMAGLAQAARWKDDAGVERIARLALQYCPRDADGVYSHLGDIELAERVLSGSGPARRADFLRFLLGQKRLADALAFQSKLPVDESVDRLRLELCEMLFWQGQREEAGRLFAVMHPEFAEAGVYNTQLRSKPSSLGFDWRLSEQAQTRLQWRPGELEVKVGSHGQPLELISILVEKRKREIERVVPLWGGETGGLYWKVDEAGPKWKRVALVAPPGGDRRFQLKEVRFE